MSEFPAPNTPEREKIIDQLLGVLRTRLVEGDFKSITLSKGIAEVGAEDGYLLREFTGGFTLTAHV